MPTEVIMPKVDMDMENGTVAVWHVEEGELVKQGMPLFDIETDKAAMEVEAPASGRIANIIAGPGDVIAIGRPLAWIYAEGEVVETVEPPDTTELPRKDLPPEAEAQVRASPLARKIARESGIDLSTVEGSGPHGRIMRRDIDAHREAKTPESDGGDSRPAPAFQAVQVSRMRATIARRLTESKATVPHFYLEMDCRLDALLALRTSLNEAMAARRRPKISVNDLIVKASALALEAVPETNASWQGDAIHRYGSVDISMAVALDDGLVTPVIRNAADRSIDDLSAEASALVEKARNGGLTPEDYQGGNFTVSNLGMFGVKSFSAIINPPESMILAVGKASRVFVPDDDDAPVAVTMLPVTLSCDHRVVDGALGARWLQHFQGAIENPMRLLL